MSSGRREPGGPKEPTGPNEPSGRRGRGGPPGSRVARRPASIAVGESAEDTGPWAHPASGLSAHPASGSLAQLVPWSAGGWSPADGTGHGGGPEGCESNGCESDGGDDGRRGAYHESQGSGSDRGGGAAAGAPGGGHADGGTPMTAGSGAVSGWERVARPTVGCPQTGQNRAPGCAGCPHAHSSEPAKPAIATAD